MIESLPTIVSMYGVPSRCSPSCSRQVADDLGDGVVGDSGTPPHLVVSSRLVTRDPALEPER